MKQNGFITINYAYKQGDVIMYADLIKVKIALGYFFAITDNFFHF